MPETLTLAEAIYVSSDYSSSDGNCIAAIRVDLEDALSPIADSVKVPEGAAMLRQLFGDKKLAASIQSAIWPSGNKGAIYTRLSGALGPIAKALDGKDDKAAAKIRALCR